MRSNSDQLIFLEHICMWKRSHKQTPSKNFICSKYLTSYAIDGIASHVIYVENTENFDCYRGVDFWIDGVWIWLQ